MYVLSNEVLSIVTLNNLSAGGQENITVGNVTSFNLTGLDPDSGYTIRVRAINDIGTSLFSNQKSFTTLAEVVLPTVPSFPIMNNAVLITETSAGISWRAPSDDGGSPILNYTLRVNNIDNGTSASQSVGNVVNDF